MDTLSINQQQKTGQGNAPSDGTNRGVEAGQSMKETDTQSDQFGVLPFSSSFPCKFLETHYWARWIMALPCRPFFCSGAKSQKCFRGK